MNEECECSSCNYFDIPVWGGAMKLRFSLIGDEGFILGFTITEIHDRLNKEYIRHSGYHPKILPPMRRRKRDIFVDVDNIHHLHAVIKRTYKVMLLQFEILSQQYAVLHLIPMKIDQVTNREHLYWLVLEIFYGLHVSVENMLPASFVLRDFLLQYLCDKYALYYNPSCVCDYFRHMPNEPCSSRFPEILNYGGEWYQM